MNIIIEVRRAPEVITDVRPIIKPGHCFAGGAAPAGVETAYCRNDVDIIACVGASLIRNSVVIPVNRHVTGSRRARSHYRPSCRVDSLIDSVASVIDAVAQRRGLIEAPFNELGERLG